MNDRERWDAKYRGAAGRGRSAPEPFVAEAVADLPPVGRALDLAAGTGRHALHLARLGWSVSAWDVSPVGLELLERDARAAGLRVETRAIDLLGEASAAPADAFELVVCVLFLDRGLFARLHRRVAPGGHLVFATATEDHPASKPPARYRLRRGELARGVPGLETVRVREVDGFAGILARKPST